MNITVFLDSKGRPLGTCPAGKESDWFLNKEGHPRYTESISQVSATEDQWQEWAKRNSQAGKTGLCIPWN
jgi:hypothetical protein